MEQLFRWVKASERLPEKSDWYYVTDGEVKDLWTRSRLVARTEMLRLQRAENNIKWLDEQPLPVSPSKPTERILAKVCKTDFGGCYEIKIQQDLVIPEEKFSQIEKAIEAIINH